MNRTVGLAWWSISLVFPLFLSRCFPDWIGGRIFGRLLRLGLCPIALYRRKRLSCKSPFVCPSPHLYSPQFLIPADTSSQVAIPGSIASSTPMCLHIYITYSLSPMRRDHPGDSAAVRRQPCNITVDIIRIRQNRDHDVSFVQNTVLLCFLFGFFFVSLLCDSAFFRIDACFVQEQER